VPHEQRHDARATVDGARAEQRDRPRPASGGGGRARSARLRDALVAPVRWLAKQTPRASRWLRRRLRFSPAAILDVFRRWTKSRGFAFWWLVVTLLLAGVVGLVVAALLAPVMGLVACLAVAVWLLFRKSTGSSQRKSGEGHDHQRGAGRDRVSPAATA
jgi:hypothetical protein